MARVLFVVIPEKGHINPYIAPAKELKKRGHQVAFYASHDVSGQLSKAGFLEHYFGSSSQPSEHSRGKDFARLVEDREWLFSWIKMLLLDHVEPQLPPLRKCIRQFQPSIIVLDPMVYAAVIAAEEEKIPWVGISSSLNPAVPEELQTPHAANIRRLAADREALFAKFNVEREFRVCDCISPALNIVFSTHEFIGSRPTDIRLVGPSIPDGPRGDEMHGSWRAGDPKYPLIYISFGSQLYYQPRRFGTFFEAVRGRPVQVLASVNEFSAQLQNVPENVTLVHYADQLEVLRAARCIVTHGGANSLMEALAFGVPILINPICNDQFHNAWFVRKAGAGLEADLERLSPKECWSMLEMLLEDPQIRKESARIEESYRQPGGRKAAELIEALL